MSIFDDFEKICKRTFRFLEDEFGFKVMAKERDSYGVSCTYQNATTGVRVSFEPREGGVFILLARLIDGKLPKYPIFVGPDTTLNSFYLNDLISIRAPGLKLKNRLENGFTQSELEDTMVRLSSALQKHAADVLQGKFGVFLELEKIVKGRQERLT